MMSALSTQEHRTFGSRTDVGRVREHNEDSLIVQPPLYVVCDGMGGHAAGEVASEMAVDVIAQRAPVTVDAEQLGQAVEEANLAIIRAAAHGIGREGMGTTCTAAMLEGTRLVIAQVGDSRAYLLHGGRMQQLTRDHSLVADLVESGQITAQEARTHPNRSVITRALGSDPRMQCDLYEMNVDEGDRLLLCSDGLYSMIDDAQIERILDMCPDAQAAADMLAEAAVDAGGHDNVTTIVVDVTGDAAARHRKLARKTKITMTVVAALVVLAFVGAFVGFNAWIGTAAYLGEVDGRVAVYQGIPGDVFGVSFSDLREVTDVPVDGLQPGVANRVRNHDIRCDSLDAAHGLIEQYRLDLFDSQKSAVPQGDVAGGGASSSSAAAAGADPAAGGAAAGDAASTDPAAAGDASPEPTSGAAT
ncbi:Stp1/IreP family PP2C-type Ser/Thr phosphatase [Adlercreutzia murintestinalis]|uniref:Stp1/IreP family PP2C-type Ser/Thr phosphatase n=1 Tax=Adlercreutzia murintestinalis TaxID=2941325 RepID=UPI0020402870|nr:Stp1/IreP family PP2C-type Ser/Thr phosphatase [Adlercreutzia murintestinalis]